MKLLSYIKFSIMALMATFVVLGCSDDDTNKAPDLSLWIRDVSVSPILSIYDGQEVVIQGRGFKIGDKLVFVDEVQKEVVVEVVKTTDKSATFVVPNALTTTSYTLFIEREAKRQELTKFIVRKTINVQVPDGPLGTNIKGAVFSGETPLAGVGVSDGEQIVKTDANGYYWMSSKKTHGYVFVISPSGYEPLTINAMPDFWSSLVAGVGYEEQHNFELERVDNANHVMFVTTDIHLANRNNDLAQSDICYRDLADYSKTFTGKKIYSLCLGDMSWDAYWYDKKFALPQYKERIKSLPMSIYHVIGNHDYDPAYKNDIETAAKFKKEIGPTFYSFNLGSIHYVVLDNIVYKNTGKPDGNIGVVGDREYDRYVSDDQIEWLKKDLQSVDATTPVVVAMHSQIYYINSLFKPATSIAAAKTTLLNDCFAKFNNVHYLTGHTHQNYNVVVSDKLMEHNTSALCATWWWTGALGNQHVGKDGTYGGYSVYELNGTDIKWHYKSVGQSKDKQFRTYDMNKVKEYYATNSVAKAFTLAFPLRDNYKSVATNSIYINVWNYDPDFTIEVTEEGNSVPLPVNRVLAEDPLHNISYDMPRWSAAGNMTADFTSNRSSHMFMVTASDGLKTLTVKVTDRFGNVYTETMRRPKLFNVTME